MCFRSRVFVITSRLPRNSHYSYPRTPCRSFAIAEMAKDKEKKGKDTLKNPKGTRDWSDQDSTLLNDIFHRIRTVLSRYATQLDTPVFELADVLKGKYGEDSKLIYDLADQGGELLSLRYDLTVPFARWLAMHPEVREYKRFAIGKVYRRDQPAIAKGRMREFYQCDVDFAGSGASTMWDSKIVAIVVEVFEALEWQGHYTIKLNHRKILDGIFEVCGVPEDKIRAISSAVDKLDKSPWEKVRTEMVETKGLDEAVADKIRTYVVQRGEKWEASNQLLETLKKDEALQANAKAKQGIDEMEEIMRILEVLGAHRDISFDLCLARGLDYYTGIIYEVVTEGSAPATVNAGEAQQVQREGKSKKAKKVLNEDDDRSDDPSVGVGSVAAGGRYDNLVERFLPGSDMQCVGVSFGVDRIFSITKARLAQGKKFSYVSSTATDVYIMAFGGKDFSGMSAERLFVEQMLARAGLKVEYSAKDRPKPQLQFKNSEKYGAKYAVILGEDEQARGEVRVKELGLPDGHPEKEGVLVKMEDLVSEVTTRIKGAEVIEQVKGLGVAN